MAARTTAAAGDWNTGATWTGGSKAVSGDTVTINHAVTVSTSEVCGTSPSSDTTVVLTISTGASLTIQNGGTLKVRGAISIQNAPLTINGGGTFTFDASQAASPSARHYRCRISSANNQANAKVICNATTDATPGIINSDNTNSGGNGYFDGGPTFSRGGRFELAYCNLTRIGTSTLYAFDTDLNSNSSDVSFADHCIFDACAGIHCQSIVDGTTFRLFHSTWKNSGSNIQHKFGSSDTITSGERSVKFCVFDTKVLLQNPRNFTVEDSVFYKNFDTTNFVWAAFERCVQRMESGDVITVPAGPKDWYVLYDFNQTNPHFLAPDGDAPSMTFDGVIFELAGADNQGDCILMPNASSAVTHTVQNCIVLPNDATSPPGQAGTLISALGGTNCTFKAEHNTYFAAGQNSGIVVGETYAGHAGMMSSAKSNLVWSPSASPGYKVYNDQILGGSPVTDTLAAANADYCLGWNTATGNQGKGWHSPMTGTPGGNDIQADPQFVDSSRNMKTWDTSLGGAGTRANALAELMKMNDRAGYNTAYTVAALLAYVRGGFVVQLTSARTGAHDGTVIGAVQDAPAAGGGTIVPILNLYRLRRAS